MEAVLRKRVRVLKVPDEHWLIKELGEAAIPAAERLYAKQSICVLLEGLQPKMAYSLQTEFCIVGGLALVGKKGEEANLFLMGTEEQFEQATKRGDCPEDMTAVFEAVKNAMKREFALHHPDGIIRFGTRPLIMGVVNVTPDSFYDGGRFNLLESAVARGMEMAEAGADIIDVGGESTRPGAEPVPEDEEKRRVCRVIEALASRLPKNVLISVDTYKVGVAEAAIHAGARMINDIFGLRRDPALAELAAHHKIPLLLMHIKGEPRTMQKNPSYDNLMGEITDSLRWSIRVARSHGVRRESLIIDPGIGFGKRWEDNLKILNRLVQLRTFGLPVLVGVSRKSFIGAVLDEPDPGNRLFGTLGACVAAFFRGADGFRVHDPKEVRETLLLASAIRSENINVAYQTSH